MAKQAFKKQRVYVCRNCGTQAMKPPLKAVKDYKTADITEFNGLGHWHCKSRCKPCKVKVVMKGESDGQENGEKAV